MQKYQHIEGKLNDVEEILNENYTRHDSEIQRLENGYDSNHRQWLFYLRENFNLLMYGIGSKTNVIKKFCSTQLENCCVLTVHGSSAKLSLRDVIKSLVVDVFGKSRCLQNVDEAIFMLKHLLKQSKFPVFLIVYNIDGVALRSVQRQEILSKLVKLPKLHLIATVDHINSPLLWSEKMLSIFNFIWIEVVTYQPYLYETWNKQILKTESSETKNYDFSVFTKIYSCGSDKLKKVIRIIVEDRLKNVHHEQQGMNLQDLYFRVQEEMLLGQQHLKSLNSLLKDFYEHGIIRKTASNGIILSVDKKALIEFHESEYVKDGLF